MTNIDRILAPIDFSKPSAHALLMAVDLARRFEARLTLLHVSTPLVDPGARLAEETLRRASLREAWSSCPPVTAGR